MKILILLVAYLLVGNSYASQNVFYCIYQNQTCVDSNEALSANESEIAGLVDLVVAGKENFLGFVDASGTTIQFFVDDLDDILVEVPVVEKKGSYGKEIDQKEMHSIVENLKFPYQNYIKDLNLEFEPW